VFWATFLVTWGGTTICKECHNLINLVLEFPKPWCIWITYYTALYIYKSLRWPQSLLGQPKIGCETSFTISKIQSLMSCKYNSVFCDDVIGDLTTQIGPASCDKKCCRDYIWSLAVCKYGDGNGLGMRLEITGMT